ncbi:Circadian clock protein kinase KaiC [Sporotomaculum syntrophicum]|uniref:Circadian clock protein kinase KaiC n=1 Tax=Sporotomaculum syntrophicum TaxID=182264 RepID=A0A9D3AY31_9FIRM|nr:RAD55 family ATPase [Sporotomaculum syntrophicum]KAF1085031.1 Circadian clock protein kinase KaiC [Sporotomaculum syntrophicum]
MHRAYFGVEGLDRSLEQGLSYGSQIMIEGDSGVGKTVLAGEFIKEGLRCGDTCVYVACDEPPAVMREHLLSFKVGTPAYEETGRLVFIDAYEEEESKEKYCLTDLRHLEKYLALESEVLRSFAGRRVRLVVDSLSTLLTNLVIPEVIDFHRTRIKQLKKKEILTMDIFVNGVLDPRLITIAGHLYNFILKMNFTGSRYNPVRQMKIGKIKSQQYISSTHTFTISPIYGIVVAADTGVYE